MNNRIHILNTQIDNLTMEETLAEVSKAIQENRLIHHTVVNAGKIVALQKNEELLEFHAENSLPEGLSKIRTAKATKILNNCFLKIDRKLEEQEWTAGDDFSLSDITWIPLYVTLHSAKFPFENYPNIIRWKEAIWKRPSFQKAVLEWM